MRIVIDLEAAQSPHSRNRGIGRYSIALAKAMLRHRGGHEIIIALNGMYADAVVPVRETFADLLPSSDIVTWHATLPPVFARTEGERRAAEVMRASFLASLKPDVVHVASLFESGPYSYTTIGPEESGFRTAVTLYDLIPHVYHDIYLHRPEAAAEYGRKIEHLCRADLWLAISEASRLEGIERLQLPDDRVVNISSAADSHFAPGEVRLRDEVDVRTLYGLWRPFVMYTGGIDHRKNIEGLIQAWAALPASLRVTHQLAIVCSVMPTERERLERLAADAGLARGDLVLTGFVPEEHLLTLYRLCKLFVFPSFHEGFGLPALEAMSCGAAVIGANNSSIPEVIGRADALFDARSGPSITAKLQQCLEDDAFRQELARHGQVQARRFSWDMSAQRALAAIEQLPPARRPIVVGPPAHTGERPRLAYVSPMPPQRSGIADYSAEILPALAAHYEIDLILDQPELDPLPAGSYSRRRDAEWFMAHGHEYDRVLYHMGNSSFHEHMLPLLARHPGTVVLHDFFLSGMQAHRELVTEKQPHWSRALYESHGWPALAQRMQPGDLTPTILGFPANFDVLRDACGVIVHSPHSRDLAHEWYGPGVADDWAVVPLPRVALPLRRQEARAELDLGPDDFLVCTFGIMGPTKMNEHLLRAWELSPLGRDPRCRLVFVGQNDGGEYGRRMQEEIARFDGRVRITGWASTEEFRRYLNASDVAVQLRTMSRGETSAAVLDAMNHAVPVIANANGSMAYLSPEAAIVLDDAFTDDELAQALEALWRDPVRRRAMGEAGRRLIETVHAPAACATAYAQAIERFAHEGRACRREALTHRIASLLPRHADDALVAATAAAIAHNVPELRPARQLLVDMTAWARPGEGSAPPFPDLVRALIERPARGWRTEPVFQDEDGQWRYARSHMQRELSCPPQLLADDLLDLQQHDVWCTVCVEGATPAAMPDAAAQLGIPTIALPTQGNPELVGAAIASWAPSGRGRYWFVDISELVRRDWQSGIQRVVKNYLTELMLHPPADAAVVPVYAVPEELGYRVAEDYLLEWAGLPPRLEGLPRAIAPRAGDVFFCLDLQPHIVPVQHAWLEGIRSRGVHLAVMVYDLLPIRLPECFGPGAAADHARWLRTAMQCDLAVCISQAVADDLALWLDEHPEVRADGSRPAIHAVHLGGSFGSGIATRGLPDDAPALLERLRAHPSFLMVGTLEPRKGHAAVLAAFERLWAAGSDAMLVIAGRRGWMVDELVRALEAHPERGQRLVWVEGGSDEYLEQLYAVCDCLIAASLGEGFGLPLVEGAQHGLPIIARDLPVFREVAGEHAWYFADDRPQPLADAIAHWLALYREGRHPTSTGMPWQTWSESAEQLKRVLHELSAGDPQQGT